MISRRQFTDRTGSGFNCLVYNKRLAPNLRPDHFNVWTHSDLFSGVAKNLKWAESNVVHLTLLFFRSVIKQ